MAHTNTKAVEKTASAAAFVMVSGAIACGVCCVLPFAFPAVALAGAGGAIAWLGGVQRWATLLGACAVAAAWGWLAWQSYRAKARPAPSTLYTMAMATAVLALAVMWPMMEPSIIRAVSPK